VKKRVRYLFTGIVQGVGFRPFVYRLATEQALSGLVQNRSDGVVVEVEGPEAVVAAFADQVRRRLPPLADLSTMTATEIAVLNDHEFRIINSEKGLKSDVQISPDMALCEDCLAELFDPADRRFRYPFINCTNCGPRLTIIKSIPYDRINTSMSCFPLCPDCREEYETPADRRFHAEPNACPVCGPSLKLLNSDGIDVPTDDPVQAAIEVLRQGYILAIKGLGGFHLSVDASSDQAVRRLRERKLREEKPLAIMVRDVETAAVIALLNEEEKALLLSPQRPIVLVGKKETNRIAPSVAPGVSDLGIMLPYTPLQYLLLEKHFHALVMTSANKAEEPICMGNREAVDRLKGIVDFFLVHNRDILVRCDDGISAVQAGRATLFRRSRGFAPKPLVMGASFPPVLALGAQQKTTVCLIRKNFAFLSPHIGDLETPLARDFFHETLALMRHITECEPRLVACDLHPGYYSTLAAAKMEGVRVIQVQHHHAHIVSGMAENGLTGSVIGLAMDGTGYGADGLIWGGEFLVADEISFQRLGHIKNFLLPGGEKAIREPWRTAVSLLREAFGEGWPEWADRLKLVPSVTSLPLVDRMIRNKINSPETSSLGRAFDGVAALLGLRRQVNFEGQAAMELEALARHTNGALLPYDIVLEGETFILNLVPAIRKIAEGKFAGKAAEELAAAFHRTLQTAMTAVAGKIREITELNRIVLSGGCFQNRILLEGCILEMEQAGFEVYRHQRVPANDGGISLGQAVSAGAQMVKNELVDNLSTNKNSYLTTIR
jgi:hydrogenase maturation protein HypF